MMEGILFRINDIPYLNGILLRFGAHSRLSHDLDMDSDCLPNVSESLVVDLMRRVRAGDEDAARELLEKFRPHLIRIIRVRLTDPRLRREFDSTDVCQSVFADFFLSARLGELEIATAHELLRYLAKAAKHRIVDRVRRSKAQKRDVRRKEAVSVEDIGASSREPTPSRVVSGREILTRAMDMMSPIERNIAERRINGETWALIAADSGESADAVRVRFSRTVARVVSLLDL